MQQPYGPPPSQPGFHAAVPFADCNLSPVAAFRRKSKELREEQDKVVKKLLMLQSLCHEEMKKGTLAVFCVESVSLHPNRPAKGDDWDGDCG